MAETTDTTPRLQAERANTPCSETGSSAASPAALDTICHVQRARDMVHVMSHVIHSSGDSDMIPLVTVADAAYDLLIMALKDLDPPQNRST